jgi:signal transduction histidine kinase
MAGKQRACCTSPAAICYWFGASLLAWAVLSIAGNYWYPLRWYGASTVLFAAGLGCVANWAKNRSFHCALTAPLFLIAAVLFVLADLRMAHVNAGLVWSLVALGTGIAFCLEWRFAQRRR